MKLIIDIPDHQYNQICKSRLHNNTIFSFYDDAIRKGIPLEQVRDEIEQTAKDYDKFDDYRRVRGLWIALDIIDKHVKEYEGSDKA